MSFNSAGSDNIAAFRSGLYDPLAVLFIVRRHPSPLPSVRPQILLLPRYQRLDRWTARIAELDSEFDRLPPAGSRALLGATDQTSDDERMTRSVGLFSLLCNSLLVAYRCMAFHCWP